MLSLSQSIARIGSQSTLRMHHLAFVLLALCMVSGCRQVRLPAIDPTGSQLFAPRPYSTTLTVPGFGDEKCGVADRLKNHFAGLGFGGGGGVFPEPAFQALRGSSHAHLKVSHPAALRLPFRQIWFQLT